MSMYPKCPVNVRLVSALVSSNCKLWLIELTYLLWEKRTNQKKKTKQNKTNKRTRKKSGQLRIF